MRTGLVALAALVVLLGMAAPAEGQTARSVTWERFDVGIELLPDGTFRVQQTEQIRFGGTFRSAFRELPFERLTSITEVQVGEAGQPYRQGYGQPGNFAVTRGQDLVRIEWWFPPTTNAVRTFQISYRVSGALRVYPEGDQLWWTVVHPRLWESIQASKIDSGPPRASDVVVRFPLDVPPNDVQAALYLGEAAQPVAAAGPREVRFSARDLPPDRPFEVRVQFPRDVVAATAPAWQAEFDRQRQYDERVRPIVNLLLLLATLGILVGGPLLILLRWFGRGRDPAGAPKPVPVAAPPGDLPPGLVGTVVDEQADLQDVLATLVDLGNRGIIRISELEDPKLAGSSRDYQLERLQQRPLGLRAFEQTVLGALFGADDTVRLSRIQDRWAANIPLFQAQLYDEAVRAGLFAANPDRVRQRWRKGALVVIGGALVGGFLASAMFGGAADLLWAPFIAAVVVGLLAMAVARRMPRRTKAGAVAAAQWKGFGEHLRGMAHQPGSLDADRFGEYLPYAVALGVDRTWLDNFASIGQPAPRWQGGNGPVIIGGPGWWGTPGSINGGGMGIPGGGGRGRRGDSSGGGAGGLDSWSGGLGGGLNSASGGLSDLLNAASEALSSGGGGGWSGGGGGGWSGGGSSGGGGSGGGGSAGFS